MINASYIVTVSDASWRSSRVGILSLPPDAATRKPPLSERPISVYLDGLDLYFDVEPTIMNDRVMVPMRKVFEMQGATLSWDANTQKVTAVKGRTSINLTTGSETAFINGKSLELDAPAIIANNRTLVTLQFIEEALNCNVSWEPENRRVIITTGGI